MSVNFSEDEIQMLVKRYDLNVCFYIVNKTFKSLMVKLLIQIL